MRVYRISKKSYATDLSGEGARRFGGRWNPKGVAMLYTSEHESLAALEVLVHTPVAALPNDLVCVCLEIPDAGITTIDKKLLPDNWHHYPSPDALKMLGHAWVMEEKSLAIKVPSSVIHTEWNVLINPKHPALDTIDIKKTRLFTFDRRLTN